MKRLLLVSFLFLVTVELSATQEIQRIDSIVKDITTLRKSYEQKLLVEKEQVKVLQEKNRAYEIQIKDLKNQIKHIEKSKKRKIIVKKICKDEDGFPKLKIKKGIYDFDASAFRLGVDSAIYADAKSNKVIAHWEKGTSFTSHIATDDRVKITGYFVNGLWQKAAKEMWIIRENVIKR